MMIKHKHNNALFLFIHFFDLASEEEDDERAIPLPRIYSLIGFSQHISEDIIGTEPNGCITVASGAFIAAVS